MTGWNFPSNGGGAINGVADSGIEIFRGKEIPSLAREICQNSLDAAADENSPVVVEFERYEIAPKDIPGVWDVISTFQACLDFWSAKSDKTEAFLKEANYKLRSSQISVLRISDFNTTGLEKPFDARAMTGWNTLTKINGGAIKSEDKAGNFGIGKNAPFANSFFRMVFYRTLNDKGERAAQAVNKLVSFNLDAENIAAGTGYYGDMQGNTPVPRIPALEKMYKRAKRGTDVFIYGFNGRAAWADELIVELIENFLVAIYRDKLCVTVQGREINKETLGTFVKDDAANYYKILTGGGDIRRFEYEFNNMGTLKLGVLVDPKVKLNRRVLIVRKSGMKLFELSRFSRTLNFTAILELEGHDLNAFFRHMETPDHTNWEPSRHPTYPARAKKYLAELKSWVRNTISSLAEADIADETEPKGLGRMLDFDNDAIAVGGNSTAVDTLDTRVVLESGLQKLPPDVDEYVGNLTAAGGNNDSNTRRTRGDVTNTGGLSTFRTHKGIIKPPGRKMHTGKENPDSKDVILTPGGRQIACRKLRVIKIGERTYRLIVRVPQTIASGRIEISALGESNTGEKLSVTKAKSVDLESASHSAGGEINFKNLRGNVDAKITFELPQDGHYALEVAVHEN